MGVINHTVLVVHSDFMEKLEQAHEKAIELLGELVTPIVNVVVNSGGSFMIGVDGSKEYWSESDDRDEKQKLFLEWAEEKFASYDEEENRFSWIVCVEVNFGELDPKGKVLVC